MENKVDLTIKDVIRVFKQKSRYNNTKIINKAYIYADKKHENQKRKSGEPYIIHPLNVAYIVAEFGLDISTICAALLHDVVEDTDTTYEDIAKEFSPEIAEIVEGVTKMSKLFETVEETQAENYKKMFMAIEKDIRIILLKLADRLHNIRTLEFLKRDKQITIANETLDVYAPIANKLGMYDLKCNLEEACLKVLHFEDYQKIIVEVNKKKEERLELLERTKKKIDLELKKQRIPAISIIQTKHIYNIYRCMKEENKTIDEIKDLFSIKILVKNRANCYIVIGILNNLYNLMPGTFKDYISVPRTNMYQAIQAILFGEKGVVFEARISSYDMNKISKYGITAYYSYLKNKHEESGSENIFQEKLKGVQNTLELEKQINDPKEFLNTLKTELFEDEVYIFTPKGEIRVLPKGATAIDFAYIIDREIGDYMVGCKINSIKMPLITPLKSGNIVEIITAEQGLLPNENWLDCIKTAKAKKEIIKNMNKIELNNIKKDIVIEILSEDRKGLILDITKSIAEESVNVVSLYSRKTEEGKAVITITMEVETDAKLIKIIDSVLKIDSIIDIKEIKKDIIK